MPEDENPTKEKKSLGLISLPPGTFEHDVAVSGKYQNFSTELLRLSLAGIGAVGFFIVNLMLSDRASGRFNWLVGNTLFGVWLLFSLLFFGISAALALLHLYFGADSKAYHLEYMRMEKSLEDKSKIDEIKKRKDFETCWKLYRHGAEYTDGDKDKTIKQAANERDVRNFLLKISGKLLLYSGIFLWLGAMALVFSLVRIIF